MRKRKRAKRKRKRRNEGEAGEEGGRGETSSFEVGAEIVRIM